MRNKKNSCLLIMILLPAFFIGADQKQVEEKARKDIEWTLKSMSVFEKQFHLNVLFRDQWTDLKKRLNRLKSQIGNEISGDNINTANQQFESLRGEIEKLIKKKDMLF